MLIKHNLPSDTLTHKIVKPDLSFAEVWRFIVVLFVCFFSLAKRDDRGGTAGEVFTTGIGGQTQSDKSMSWDQYKIMEVSIRPSPTNPTLIDHFRYIKIHTWLRGLGRFSGRRKPKESY